MSIYPCIHILLCLSVILVVFVAREKNAAKLVKGRLVSQWKKSRISQYLYMLHKGLLLKF